MTLHLPKVEYTKVDKLQNGGPNMPLYQDIANHIGETIRQGKYTAGDRLPDQKKLAEQFKTSRMTIQKALNILNAAGMTYSVQGSGTYVKHNIDEMSKLNLRVDQYVGTSSLLGGKAKIVSQVIKFKVDFPTKDEQERLHLDPGDPVYHIIRLRNVDGAPFALEHTAMPVGVIPGINDEVLHKSIYGYIRTNLKKVIGAAYREISADKPDHYDKEYLHCDDTTPVLQTFQVVYLEDGTPFEYSATRRRYDSGSVTVLVPRRPHM
jgi:GntR family transcriptional regulator